MYKNDINGIWTTKDELSFLDRLGLHSGNMGGAALDGCALLEYRSECYAGYIDFAKHREWGKIDGSVCVARARKCLNEIKAQMAQETDGVAA